ncbi:hypothetical protein [Luteirhabdus pelagi]|uniref:hypothetical protein n=1 Tax=Luteirhabdus pelagi TaxID=2792783 RepID=UPI00193A9F3A|nr:hypothetical protein [Luteirhabdus pelagi]
MFRNKITIVLISLVLLSFSNCGSSQNTMELTSNPPFEIGEAYYQNWVAGVPEGGSGTDVYITFASVEEGVVFQQLYFQGKAQPLNTSPRHRIRYEAHFKKNSKSDMVMDADSVKESQNTPPQKVPFELEDNQAVISFTQNGTQHYYKVASLERKETLAYPGAPKDDN